MVDIIKNYGSNFKISGPFSAIPLEWFTSTKEIYSPKLLRPINDEHSRVKLARKCYISAVTFLLIIFQHIFASKYNPASKSNEIVIWLIISLLSLSIYYVYFFRKNVSHIAEFINGLIQFDSMYPKNPKTFREMTATEFLSMIMVLAAFLSQILFPLAAVLGLHWTNPRKSSLAMYWLIPEQDFVQGNLFLEMVLIFSKLVVMMYNCWMWTFVLNGSAFAVGFLFTLAVTTTLKNIEG